MVSDAADRMKVAAVDCDCMSNLVAVFIRVDQVQALLHAQPSLVHTHRLWAERVTQGGSNSVPVLSADWPWSTEPLDAIRSCSAPRVLLMLIKTRAAAVRLQSTAWLRLRLRWRSAQGRDWIEKDLANQLSKQPAVLQACIQALHVARYVSSDDRPRQLSHACTCWTALPRDLLSRHLQASFHTA